VTESFSPSRKELMGLYDGMLAAYGEQDWWPADSAFEVAVGAVLTQNTNWSNVECAIANLKSAGVLDQQALLSLPHEQLAELIRPSGYYNIKAQRLRALLEYLERTGGLERLAQGGIAAARQGLLSVNGVGPETADDILLYALDQPVFVIDTYTRRLLTRNGLAEGAEGYEELRRGFEAVLPADADLFKEYHALIVQHAKAACRKQPACQECCLKDSCAQLL
jgi:endonuclease-3 related protein